MLNFEKPNVEFNFSTTEKVDGTIQDLIDTGAITLTSLTGAKLLNLKADINDSNKSYLRIRDDNGIIIGKLKEGKSDNMKFIDKKIVKTSKGNKVFLKIKTSKTTGWVSADYLHADIKNSSTTKNIEKIASKKTIKDTSEITENSDNINPEMETLVLNSKEIKAKKNNEKDIILDTNAIVIDEIKDKEGFYLIESDYKILKKDFIFKMDGDEYSIKSSDVLQSKIVNDDYIICKINDGRNILIEKHSGEGLFFTKINLDKYGNFIFNNGEENIYKIRNKKNLHTPESVKSNYKKNLHTLESVRSNYKKNLHTLESVRSNYIK